MHQAYSASLPVVPVGCGGGSRQRREENITVFPFLPLAFSRAELSGSAAQAPGGRQRARVHWPAWYPRWASDGWDCRSDLLRILRSWEPGPARPLHWRRLRGSGEARTGQAREAARRRKCHEAVSALPVQPGGLVCTAHSFPFFSFFLNFPFLMKAVYKITLFSHLLDGFCLAFALFFSCLVGCGFTLKDLFAASVWLSW